MRSLQGWLSTEYRLSEEQSKLNGVVFVQQGLHHFTNQYRNRAMSTLLSEDALLHSL